MSDTRTLSLDERYRRALRWGLVLSLLGHAALFLYFNDRPIPPSPFSAAGERRGDARAALGGGMQAVDLRSPPPEVESPPEPIPQPTEDVLEVEPEPEPEVLEVGIVAPELSDVAMLPGLPGAEEGPGLADGTGQGDGGTEAEGLFRVVPPRPRGMILPPRDPPDRVRGREVDVWVFVSSVGRVIADSTRLDPPTGDRGFDRRLREHAAGWVFEAARRDGSPVAEWFRYTIIM